MPPQRRKRSAPRQTKCSYLENGRRCPRNGDGNPPLCPAHQIAVAEASRPRSARDILRDAFVSMLQGKPVDMREALGAADEVVHQWAQSHDGRMAGWRMESRRAAAAGQPPPPRPSPPPRPGPDPVQEALREQRAARQVMGFAASEPLTEDKIRARKKTLAIRYHPDRPNGSLEKMTAINAAADVLVRGLSAA